MQYSGKVSNSPYNNKPIQYSESDLSKIFRDILRNGIHGLSFSAYLEGQKPGSIISEEQIITRMSIISPYIKWVRSFSCLDGNEIIPKVAKRMGINTLVGAWLGDDEEKNKREFEALIKLAKDGFVDIAAIGNEVLLRNELDEEHLIKLIKEFKNRVPGIPVGYVDAYFQFEIHPLLTSNCDVILTNCYPFWEECPIAYAHAYMKEMYHRTVKIANGKKVIISETGWPNLGSPVGGALPSDENAIRYFVDAYKWAAEENIDIFYFSSFDENWKVDAEGDVGAFWGLWDKDGKLKY